MSKHTTYTPTALKVYWQTDRYGITYTAVLCPAHKSILYKANPSAYGMGEDSPIEDCEMCQGKSVPSFRVWLR